MASVMHPTRGTTLLSLQRILDKRLISSDEIGQVMQWVEGLYSQPHRHYHTLVHIDEVVAACLLMASSAADLDCLVLAAIFHDAVYDTHRADNEQQSAALANQILLNIIHPYDRDYIQNLILGTKHHDDPETHLAAVLYDADLLRLASPAFREYSIQIRQEYDWVPEEAYRKARSDILESFLLRDQIYHVATEFEDLARRNLEEAISALAS